MSLYDAIGMTLEPWSEPGRSEGRIPVHEPVLNPNRGVHGGAIATLVDSTAAHAVRSHLGDPRAEIYTVELAVSFFRPIRGSEVRARGRSLKVGRTLSFAEVEVLDADGTPVATGRVTFAMQPRSPRSTPGASEPGHPDESAEPA